MPRKKSSSGRKKTSQPSTSTSAGRGSAARGSAGGTSAGRDLAARQSVSTDSPSRGRGAEILVREAHRDDIPELEEFVERFVQANRLLPRTTDELYDLVPFGFVAYCDERLVGFAALEIYSAKLAEVRSLAVHEDYQGRGIGKQLVQKCVELAHMRNILEVMAITSSDGFFKACGFDFTLPGEKKALFMQTRDEY